MRQSLILFLGLLVIHNFRGVSGNLNFHPRNLLLSKIVLEMLKREVAMLTFCDLFFLSLLFFTTKIKWSLNKVYTEFFLNTPIIRIHPNLSILTGHKEVNNWTLFLTSSWLSTSEHVLFTNLHPPSVSAFTAPQTPPIWADHLTLPRPPPHPYTKPIPFTFAKQFCFQPHKL